MAGYFRRVEAAARWSSVEATKSDLFSGSGLFAGLNCFEPGQHQNVHVHEGADKFYFVVSGKARITVGEESHDADAGTVVWAPAGVPHGVGEAIERTVLLVAIAPPPRRSKS